MSLNSRVAQLERWKGWRDDDDAPVYVVIAPEKLSPEAWTKMAREHARGGVVTCPMREIKYQGRRQLD